MRTTTGTNGHKERNGSDRAISSRERFRRVLRRILGAGSLALALCALACGSSNVALAQSSSATQLVIDATQTANSIDEDITSVVFSGDYTLTLIDGQVLRPVLLSRSSNAELVLGNGVKSDQVWTIYSNSPSWTGTIHVLDDNDLILDSGAANPLGAYSEANTGNYGSLVLYNGSTFSVPQEVTTSGALIQRETKMGRLETDYSNLKAEMDFAEVNVGAGQTLTVENGIDVDDMTGLIKSGEGELQIVANGSGTLGGVNKTGYTTLNLGDMTVAGGTLSVVDGTAKVEDASLSVSTIALGQGATLDIQSLDTINLYGESGDVVFEALDGSTINFYVASENYTKYVATTYNTYINIGDATFEINSTVPGTEAPESLTLFSTVDVGQTTYDAADIVVHDNILGKNYAVDKDLSTSDKIVVSLEDSANFADVAPEGNGMSAAKALDRLVDSGKYTLAEYAELAELESNMKRLTWDYATGEIYASSIAFTYMNNLMTQQALYNNLRNNALVSYSESAAGVVNPQDYDAGRINVQQGQNQNSANYPIMGGAANGNFDGPLYYNSDSNSYAPGVVPTPAYYNNETIGGYGDVNSYGLFNPQYSTLRGQEAQYGDPGTLIYSAWAEAFGSSLQARQHKSYYGYDGKQFGVLAGLDLFGSCDCRFGAYYGYQHNELESLSSVGVLETNEHQIGLYHQFGDEDVYNIATVHGGFGRYETRRVSALLDEMRTLFSKYNAWNAGASFERGMNFKMQPLTLSPYAQLEYNYFNRPSFTEQGAQDWAYTLKVNRGNFHSLRGQIGGRVALDMYPGEQQVRIVFNAAYVHEFLDAIYGQTHVSFTGLPTSSGFDVYGNSLGRDWAILGLGGEWAPIPALDLFVRGDYILNKYTRNPGGSAGLKYRW